MLDPGRYNQTIKGLENNIESWEKELEEEQFLHFVYTKGIHRLIIGVVLSLVWLGVVAFLNVYAPARQMIIDTLQINLSKVLDVERLDFWKLVFLFMCFGAVEVLIVCWASGDNYLGIIGRMAAIGVFSAGVLMLPGGVVLLCLDIKNVVQLRKESMQNIQEAQEKLEEIRSQIETEKTRRTEEQKALKESDWMFAQGRRKKNMQMIQQAANMGNPQAVEYLDDLNKKAQQEEAECYFQEARQSSPVNEALLEKAANMGHARASVAMVEHLFEKALSSRYTRKEKEEMIKTADSYLEKTDFMGCPDGELLKISRQLDRKELENPLEALKKARKAAESGTLSQRYRKLADSLVERLVAVVDNEAK